MTDENASVAVHWSFFVIAIVGLLFNLAGVANFVMQMNPENVASMPDVYRAMIENRPGWATAAFALAVFGGTLGCLLLLFRKSAAVYLLSASLAGALVTQVPLLSVQNVPSEAWIGWGVQLVVTGLLIGYARWSNRRGWIRQGVG